VLYTIFTNNIQFIAHSITQLILAQKYGQVAGILKLDSAPSDYIKMEKAFTS
jgi:hypothetical protein